VCNTYVYLVSKKPLQASFEVVEEGAQHSRVAVKERERERENEREREKERGRERERERE